MRPASGAQIVLSAGGQEATVVTVSGGVRTYRVDGEEVLDGYGEDEAALDARGQLLIPWPNRLRDGRYEFAGETHQVPLTEPARGNAIHGFIRWENWLVDDRQAASAVLSHTIFPRAGYPFMVHLTMTYALAEDGSGLRCALEARNDGSTPCPFGAGAHPYLRVGHGSVDDLLLEAPGATRLVTDDGGIPIGSEPVAGGALDYRSRRAIGPAILDTAFTDLNRDCGGRAWVRLYSARTGRGIGLWMDEAHTHYMLFTGDSLPETERRRRSLGVEPMTCAPNALASGEGLAVIAPGDTFTARWGIAPLLGAP